MNDILIVGGIAGRMPVLAPEDHSEKPSLQR
jgi:hypothetical protein